MGTVQFVGRYGILNRKIFSVGLRHDRIRQSLPVLIEKGNMKIDGAKAAYLSLNYDDRAVFRKRVNQDSVFWRVPVPEEDEEDLEEQFMIQQLMLKIGVFSK